MDHSAFALAGLVAMAAISLVHLTMMRSDEAARLRDHIDVVLIGGAAMLLAMVVAQHLKWFI